MRVIGLFIAPELTARASNAAPQGNRVAAWLSEVPITHALPTFLTSQCPHHCPRSLSPYSAIYHSSPFLTCPCSSSVLSCPILPHLTTVLTLHFRQQNTSFNSLLCGTIEKLPILSLWLLYSQYHLQNLCDYSLGLSHQHQGRYIHIFLECSLVFCFFTHMLLIWKCTFFAQMSTHIQIWFFLTCDIIREPVRV